MLADESALRQLSWQAFERYVARLLICEGYEGVRLVGQSRDRGADILAHREGVRWLVQVKHWRAPAGAEVIDRTLDAARTYRARVPVIVSLSGFDRAAHGHQALLLSRQIPLQLWDTRTLLARASRLPDVSTGQARAARIPGAGNPAASAGD